MRILEKPVPSSRREARTAKPPAPKRDTRDIAAPEVKLLLVAFRSGEAVEQHPALGAWLDDGWQVRSAVPRVIENGATRLLVVLERPMRNGERRGAPATLQRMRALRE